MSLKEPGVYCIKNTWSEKLYVGSSRNMEARIKRHLRMLKNGTHHSPKLQSSWNFHGEEVFEVGVLVRCSVNELLQREQEWIFSFDSVNNGYNCAKHAGSPMKGRIQSDETKAKMAASHKARKPISEETRQRMREASALRETDKKAAGFKVSDETKAKLKAAGKGREVSVETREKIRLANAGKPLSEEHRQKLSDAQRAREKNSEAEIAGFAAAARKRTGVKRSEEFKQRMSAPASNRTEERRAKLVAAATGKSLTEEHRSNLSKARRAHLDNQVIIDLLEE